MLKGELDYSVVGRAIITIEAITGGEGVPKRKRFQSWDKVVATTKVDQVVLNRLWLFGNRTGLTIELALFGVEHEYQIGIGQRLERGLDPFRFIECWESRKALLDHLAYRPDVVAVVDTPPLIMQWGARGMSLEDVSRI